MNPESSELLQAERCVIELVHPQGVIPDFLVPVHEKTLKDIARAFGVLGELQRDNLKVEVADPVEVEGNPNNVRYRQITFTTTLSEKLRTAFTDALLGSGYQLAPERQPLRIHSEVDTDGSEGERAAV